MVIKVELYVICLSRIWLGLYKIGVFIVGGSLEILKEDLYLERGERGNF